VRGQGKSAQFVPTTGVWTKQLPALKPGIGYKLKAGKDGEVKVK